MIFTNLEASVLELARSVMFFAQWNSQRKRFINLQITELFDLIFCQISITDIFCQLLHRKYTKLELFAYYVITDLFRYSIFYFVRSHKLKLIIINLIRKLYTILEIITNKFIERLFHIKLHIMNRI